MSITNIDLICVNCMREKPDSGVCPYCGFDESKYEPSPHHLPPRSILGGKCLVGRVLGEGGFGITYLGWDLNLDLKLAIKEYYPTGFVTRTNTTTTTVTPFHGEKTEFFTKGRSRFIDEAKTLLKNDASTIEQIRVAISDVKQMLQIVTSRSASGGADASAAGGRDSGKRDDNVVDAEFVDQGGEQS